MELRSTVLVVLVATWPLQHRGSSPLKPLHGERQRLVELLDDAARRVEGQRQWAVLQRVVGGGRRAPLEGQRGGLQAPSRHADQELFRRQRRRHLHRHARQLDWGAICREGRVEQCMLVGMSIIWSQLKFLCFDYKVLLTSRHLLTLNKCWFFFQD